MKYEILDDKKPEEVCYLFLERTADGITLKVRSGESDSHTNYILSITDKGVILLHPDVAKEFGFARDSYNCVEAVRDI